METRRLAPSAFAGLRDVAGNARDLWVIEIRDTHLIVGRKKIKCRTDANQLLRPSKSRGRNEEYRRHKIKFHFRSPFPRRLRASARGSSGFQCAGVIQRCPQKAML